MTKLTKFTLILAAIVAGVLLTAALAVQAYEFRGGFSIGGEWLVIPALAAFVQVVREVRRLFEATMRRCNHERQ